MATLDIDKKRRWEKNLENQYDIPSVAPSSNHTDGTWNIKNIYDREICLNNYDKKAWVRLANAIKEFLFFDDAIDLHYSLMAGTVYFWRNATDKAAQTGQIADEKGLQADNRIIYNWSGSAWVEWASLDALANQDYSITYTWANQAAQDAQTGMIAGELGRRTDTNNVYRYNGVSWEFWFDYDALEDISNPGQLVDNFVHLDGSADDPTSKNEIIAGEKRFDNNALIKSMLLLNQGADIAIPGNGLLQIGEYNYVRLSSIGILKRISFIKSTRFSATNNWRNSQASELEGIVTGGTFLTLDVKTGTVIENNSTPDDSGAPSDHDEFRPVVVGDGESFTAPYNCLVELVADKFGKAWKINNIRQSESVPPPTRVEFIVNVTADEITAAGGTLTLTPSVTFTAGDVKVFDGNSNEFTLTSGASQDISYVAADLGGEPNKDFILVFEFTEPENVNFIYLERCNVRKYDNLIALNNTDASFDFEDCKLEGNPLDINEFTELDTFNIDGNLMESFVCNLLKIRKLADSQPSIGLPNAKSIDLSNSLNLIGTTTGFLEIIAPLLEYLNISNCAEVQLLDVQDANLTGIDPVIFQLNNKLTSITLDYNNINELNSITECKNLQTLNLFFCDILSMDGLPIFGIISLISVNLRANVNLTGKFDARTLVNATKLMVNACNLNEIIFDGLINLRDHSTNHAAFGNVNLTKYSANGCTSLIGTPYGGGIMNLHDASLTYLDLTDCNSILQLQARNNNLGGGTLLLGGLTSCLIYILTGNGLNQTEVDYVSAQADASGLSNGSITIVSGNTGDPTLSPSYASLIGKGWTIN